MEKKLPTEIFHEFRDFIHANYGIFYADYKKDLLSIKINKCLCREDVTGYEEYYALITSPQGEQALQRFVDEITVNKTDFFRESEHYEFIKTQLPFILESSESILKTKTVKVWSMACSTGEEPYSAAMVLDSVLPKNINIRILATDLSGRVLKTAKQGVYPPEIEQAVPDEYIKKYLKKNGDGYVVGDSIKKLITFRQFNLVNDFPFDGRFDIIFCRNVMIYFNIQTQQKLLAKIYDSLAPGGLLFVGQSETLLNKQHDFSHIKSSIYIKQRI